VAWEKEIPDFVGAQGGRIGRCVPRPGGRPFWPGLEPMAKQLVAMGFWGQGEGAGPGKGERGFPLRGFLLSHGKQMAEAV
jgi:hypothetical protein